MNKLPEEISRMSVDAQLPSLQDQLVIAQIEKTRLESDVLKKPKWQKQLSIVVDSAKLLGALLVAILGVATGIQGAGEAKAAKEQAEKDAAVAHAKLQSKRQEVEATTAQLAEKQRALSQLEAQLSSAASQLAQLQTALVSLPPSPTAIQISDAAQKLDSSLGDALVGTASPSSGSETKSLDELIAGLFASTASVRGTAYKGLMGRFTTSQDLIPKLLDYARKNPNNQNGVYNTLVVLSHLDYSALPGADIPAIKKYAGSVRTNGGKTSERIDKLLQRLPK